MGRSKVIKVVCIKDFTDYISEDELIFNRIEETDSYSTPIFKEGETYTTTRELNTSSGAIIRAVDSKLKIFNHDPDHSKFIHERFYVKNPDEKMEERKNRIKKFYEYKEKLVDFDFTMEDWISPLERQFDDYFRLV